MIQTKTENKYLKEFFVADKVPSQAIQTFFSNSNKLIAWMK